VRENNIYIVVVIRSCMLHNFSANMLHVSHFVLHVAYLAFKVITMYHAWKKNSRTKKSKKGMMKNQFVDQIEVDGATGRKEARPSRSSFVRCDECACETGPVTVAEGQPSSPNSELELDIMFVEEGAQMPPLLDGLKRLLSNDFNNELADTGG
jgi:hypothetical protein